MKKFKITEELIQVLGQYLTSKPYAEVAQLIAELSKLEEIKE